MRTTVNEAGRRLGVSATGLFDAINNTRRSFKERQETFGLEYDHLEDRRSCEEPLGDTDRVLRARRLQKYLFELKACLKTLGDGQSAGRLHHAVLCTFAALVRGMQFDRATLLRWSSCERDFVLVASYGLPFPDPKAFHKGGLTEGREKPHIKALAAQDAVFTGDLVFDDGWPFAAFPVTSQGEVLAVFYADCKAPLGSGAEVHDFWLEPLDMSQQVGVVALAEAWRSVPGEFY
jgi:hypothetical protein